MDGTYFAELCDNNGCRIDAFYDVLKIRYTDEGVELIPVKMKGNLYAAEITEPVDIKMYSDYTCPWCLMAYAVLETMKARIPINLEHIGIEIHPETAESGAAVSGNICAQNTIRRINSRGKEYGLHLLDNQFSVNTHKALVAGEYAKEKGLHNEYVKAMWEAYLVNGKNIGNIEEICRIAGSIGLSPEETAQAVGNPKYEEKLQDNQLEADKYRIHAVPSFIVNDRYLIVGFEDESFFERVFERL